MSQQRGYGASRPLGREESDTSIVLLLIDASDVKNTYGLILQFD